MNKLYYLILFALLQTLSVMATGKDAEVTGNTQTSFGRATNFNAGWRFILADDSAAVAPDYDDSKWRQLDLPHDWSIEGRLSPTLASCTGYLPGGIGWYRKTFTVTDDAPRHYIYFEGVYNRSTVYLNGHRLGHRPNGYISFMYDLTPYLREGENVIAVRVDHSRYADSRWYTGSGIYRDVWMVAAPQTHFALWGTGWKATQITDKSATIAVDATIERHESSRANLQVKATLRDARGRVVASAKGRVRDNRAQIDLRVSRPQRWSLSNPYLYQLTTELFADGQAIDAGRCAVGLRTLTFDANRGFALNGQWMKVKGACIHHDAGTLGAVVPPEVWERRLKNLKSIGCNAVRMSHNPHAPIVYDLCDRLGLLVMDEGSDEWEFPKRKWVEGWNVGTPSYDGTFDFFEEWIERDVTDMVRRDRNHPCIFLWSVGNEVDYPNDPYSHPVLDGAKINQPMFGGYKPDAPHADRIGKIAKRLASAIRAIDDSRPTTGAMAGVVMSNETEYPDAIDVCGYNYTEDRYAMDHAAYPNRIIYGSENGRGYDAWLAVKNNDYIFGQFIWTGTDYLGESGRWPSRGLHTGLLDFGSYPKPNGYFHASMWMDTPMAFIGTYPKRPGEDYLSEYALDTWNYEAGDSIRVVCYTNTAQARLLLDGREVGSMKPFDEQRGIMYWDIPFAPGQLKVEGCDKQGQCVATYSITTSGRPYALQAEIDPTGLIAPADARTPARLNRERATAHIEINVLDEKGLPVKLADNLVTCRISGPARLLGLEGSDNTDMGDYRDNHQRVFNGRLLAYIQTTGEAGEITVTFISPLLKGASVTLKAE